MYSWISQAVFSANVERSPADIDRRFIKFLEELGELSEAYLSVTSSSNHKGLSWEDFREEAIDTLIMTIDIALTPICSGGERPRPYSEFHS